MEAEVGAEVVRTVVAIALRVADTAVPLAADKAVHLAVETQAVVVLTRAIYLLAWGVLGGGDVSDQFLVLLVWAE